jgi:hypothetical protein
MHNHLVTDSKAVAVDFVTRYAEPEDGHTAHISISRDGSEYDVLVTVSKTEDDEGEAEVAAPPAMPDVANLVSRYSELVVIHGVGSPEAEEFIRLSGESPGFVEFLQLAPVVNKLRKACQAQPVPPVPPVPPVSPVATAA